MLNSILLVWRPRGDYYPCYYFATLWWQEDS